MLALLMRFSHFGNSDKLAPQGDTNILGIAFTFFKLSFTGISRRSGAP